MNLFGKILFEILGEWFSQRFLHGGREAPTLTSTVSPLVMRRIPVRQNVFSLGYRWITYLCVKAFYGLVAVWCFNLWILLDTAKMNANNALKDAEKGVSNQKCIGELAVAQRALCDRYDATLSRWYPSSVLIELMKLVPSCLVMECSDIWTEINNSWMAWVIWITVVIIVIVSIVQFGAWVARKMTGTTTRASIVAVHQDQDYYHDHLSPSIRHVIDEPLRINAYAQAQNNRPALMPKSERRRSD